MRQKTIPIRRFEAVDDAGHSYSIVGSQKLIEPKGPGKAGADKTGAGEAGKAEGTEQWEPQPPSLRTIDGRPVKYLAKGIYEIRADTPIRVTATDPRAP